MTASDTPATEETTTGTAEKKDLDVVMWACVILGFCVMLATNNLFWGVVGCISAMIVCGGFQGIADAIKSLKE